MVIEQLKNWINKNSWIKEIGIFRIGLIVLAGVVLLVLSMPPGTTKKQVENKKKENVIEEKQLEKYIETQEKRLTEVLGMVEGIGEVKVMITAKSNGETVVLKDVPYDRSETKEEDAQGGTREQVDYTNQEKTVLQEENGNQEPFVTKELEPEIEGVVIIAEGGGNNKIVAEINEAVVALFSIPSHKIKVMKMK